MKRKSGDLPEANRASFGSEGRAEEHSRQTPLARALPVFLSHPVPVRFARARLSLSWTFIVVRAGLSSPQLSTNRQGVGKAVRIRHYPVTVSEEARPQATGERSPGRRPQPMKREVRRPVPFELPRGKTCPYFRFDLELMSVSC